MKKLGLAGSLMFAATSFMWGLQTLHQQTGTPTQTEQSSQVSVPNRPPSPLFKGEQGAQQSQIKFTPATRQVTIKLHVEDPNGYFLPNLHPDNFVVYEDGVRQKNVAVDVEHAPVSIALLMEFGGRYHELNQSLAGQMDEGGDNCSTCWARTTKWPSSNTAINSKL